MPINAFCALPKRCHNNRTRNHHSFSTSVAFRTSGSKRSGNYDPKLDKELKIEEMRQLYHAMNERGMKKDTGRQSGETLTEGASTYFEWEKAAKISNERVLMDAKLFHIVQLLRLEFSGEKLCEGYMRLGGLKASSILYYYWWLSGPSYSCREVNLYRVIEGHASITPLSRSDLPSEVDNHGGAGLVLSGQETRNSVTSALLGETADVVQLHFKV
jgi:hypothetical protein